MVKKASFAAVNLHCYSFILRYFMPSPSAISQHLPVEHRAYVALYALQLGKLSRQAILETYEVTEADLQVHRAAWEELQASHADRNRPLPRVKLAEES